MNQNKKIIFFSIFLNFSALLVLFLIICPLHNGIKQESENLISEKTLLRQTIEKNKNIEQTEQEHKNYAKNLEKINNLFISPETPINFVEFLENMAQDFNLSMKITPQSLGKQEKNLWASMNLDINLIGSFPDLSKFIEKLEYSCFPSANQENGYLIEITNLRLKSLSEKDLYAQKFEKFKIKDIDAHFSIKIATK